MADIPRSLDYYTKVLGFKVIWVLNDAEGNPDFANVHRDELTVFLARYEKPLPSVLNAHCDKTEFIDSVFAEYKVKGAIIAEPPSDRPWGLYEMRVLDLDGNVLRMQACSEKKDL